MIKGIFSFVFLVTFVLCAFFVINSESEILNQDSISNFVTFFGQANSFVFVLVYIVATVLMVPGSALTLYGGLAFGAYWGTLYSLIGATSGATVSFLLSRYFLRNFVVNRFPNQMKVISEGMQHGNELRYLTFVRLVPLFPFNVINYVFGVTRMKASYFFVITFVSMIPGAALYSYIGDAGAKILGGAQDLKLKVTGICVAVAILLFVPGIFKKRLSGRKPRPNGAHNKTNEPTSI